MQKHTHKARDLVNSPTISAMDSMISLAVDISEHIVLLQIIKESWNSSLKDAKERYKSIFFKIPPSDK